jgi:hypothetical protein
MGSDHDVYQDSSFKIPAIYLNDWPDRYIHTNFDTAANIDPTKLKRAAFIGAASGYYLASMNGAGSGRVPDDLGFVIAASREAQRAAGSFRAILLPDPEKRVFWNGRLLYDQSLAPGLSQFLGFPLSPPRPADGANANRSGVVETAAKGDGLLIFSRKPDPKGPVTVFGSDYVADHSAGIPTPKVLDYQGLWGGGEEYAYEILNFVDGKRNAQQIRDRVSAEYGPIRLALVVEYLKALEKIGILEQAK